LAFIVRIYHEARYSESQKLKNCCYANYDKTFIGRKLHK